MTQACDTLNPLKGGTSRIEQTGKRCKLGFRDGRVPQVSGTQCQVYLFRLCTLNRVEVHGRV